MSALFKKLNLGAHEATSVFNAPASFEPELKALPGVVIERDPKRPTGLAFALSFATTQAELDRLSARPVVAGEGDVVPWFAYPRGTSPRYRCDFNRDSGWGVLTRAGFDSVRMVAIDEDWSALRFRRKQVHQDTLMRPGKRGFMQVTDNLRPACPRPCRGGAPATLLIRCILDHPRRQAAGRFTPATDGGVMRSAAFRRRNTCTTADGSAPSGDGPCARLGA